jgi:hypothetical protein
MKKKLNQNIEVRKPEWSLKIIKADNGYILEGISYHPDDGEVVKIDSQIVLEEDKNCREAEDLKIHVKLLWEVLEYFGAYGSKHSNRINIEIRDPDGKVIEDE